MDHQIKIKLSEFRQLARQLLCPDENSEYYYPDERQRAQLQLTAYFNELLQVKGETSEEEAQICLALLVGNSVMLYRKGKDVQMVLDRAGLVLPMLDASPLKHDLLMSCYYETEMEELAEEAKKQEKN